MRDKILSITEDDGFKVDKDDWCSYEGIIITTDKQKLYFGISSGQSCCESYGYLTSEDDYSDFIGSEILKVYITDDKMETIDLDMNDFDWGGGAIFVNIETTKGKLQFVAYNAHNGYYGHSVIVKSNQLNLDDGV